MFISNDLVECFLSNQLDGKGIYLLSEGIKERFISYQTVLERSLRLSRKLEKIGAVEGSEIIIECLNPENFIYAFWACLLHGFVAVPMDAKHSRYSEDMKRSFISKLGKCIVVTDSLDSCSAIDGKTIYISEDCLSSGESYKISNFQKELNQIAYIQFSSGSTSQPKGVVMRKFNIYADVLGIAKRQKLSKNDLFLTWQPLTHCYGLIAFHVLPVMLGANQYIIPTDIFMKTPLIWLEAASKFHITRLGTIPFALKHFMDVYKKSNQKHDWNLSQVKSILIGAEQISKELCDNFVNSLCEFGLNENVMMPLYGLAETVTIASLHDYRKPLRTHNISRENLEIGQAVTYISDEESDSGSQFLEIGSPISTAQIAVTNELGESLPDSTIGHICIKGDIVTTGYYKDEEEINQVLTEDGWLDTGDIGFMKDGRLTIVGRFKELIVKNGKKYSCTDMESVLATQLEEETCKKAVACSVFSDSIEKTIIFVEAPKVLKKVNAQDECNRVASKIRTVLYQVFNLEIDQVAMIEKIPRTFSGKIRRVELMNKYLNGEIRAMVEERRMTEDFGMEPSYEKLHEKVQKTLIAILKDNFNIVVDDINAAFKECGIISVNIPLFAKEINKIMGLHMDVTQIFDYPNIKTLADFLCHSLLDKNKAEISRNIQINDNRNENEKIAIVGMSCRFPGGSNSIQEFWDILMSGTDCICDVPESRWKLDKYYSEDDNAPGKMYCRKGGFLNVPIDEFDAGFFNISPKEAIALDPQQRLLLELVWEAFENAQIPIKKYENTNTGVFLGVSTDEYAMAHIYSGELSRIDAYSLTGMCKSTACGRISYTFGFEGPSVAVDTACSSSLTALHFACEEIKKGNAGLAVVAGINLIVSPATNIGFSKLRATSKDGHSKSFDESANGYGRGEGGGVLLLKKLSAAINDGDNILGVVCASAINQDGKSNGLTAPNGRSQVDLVENVLRKANLKPEDVDYIEMHGTGTKLGDPIEINAILDTYCRNRSPEDKLKIGSVKSNIGHLEAGAGIASVVKVLLSIKNKQIPGNLNFNTPNKMIDWANVPLEVVKEHTEWTSNNRIRRAGINGFGFGGSNAHVIIEEYIPEKRKARETKGIEYILKVSAKSVKSLQEEVEKYYACIKEADEAAFLDILYAANRKRMDFDYRISITASSRDKMLARLEKYMEGDLPIGVYTNINENPLKKNKQIVFMFTGQGSQYVNMGKLLYETNAVFHNAMDECNELFEPYTLTSLIRLIYSENADAGVIGRTIYAQPLIFMVEYSLAKMWAALGVKPNMVIGHSIGEYAAAVVAGSLSLADAVKLVSVRGRLMESAPGQGTMATIFASTEAVNELLTDYKDTISIAAHNAKENFVISGSVGDVRVVLKKAEEKGIRIKELEVSHGFHSMLMEPILDSFSDLAQKVEVKKPQIPFISCLYARKIEDKDVFDYRYWTKHITQKVDFYGAITSIGSPQDYIFLEIGANTVLSALAKMIFGPEIISVGSLSLKKNTAMQLSECIAALYGNGVAINWEQVGFNGTVTGNPVVLPNYAFERSRYWLEPLYDRSGAANIDTDKYDPLLGQKIESPAFADTVIMQRKFTAADPYFMSEHIIFHAAISPAAAHISMLLSAAKNVKNLKSVSIREMELRNPLIVLEGDERTVQVCIKNSSPKEAAFSIVSRDCDEDDTDWVTHTQGRLIAQNDNFETDIKCDFDALANIKFDDDTEEILYGSMNSSGFHLGDGFRRVTQNYNDSGKGICVIEPLKSIPEIESYELYPGVIDSLLQTMLCIYYKNQKQKNLPKNDKTIIPYYIGKITYNYIPSDKLWCYVDINNEGDILYGAVTAFNDKGEVVIEIKEFMAKFTTKEVLLRNQKNQAKNVSYFTDWEETSFDKNAADKTPVKYVVVSDDKDKFQALQAALKNDGSSEIAFILIESNWDAAESLKSIYIEEASDVKFIYAPKNADSASEEEAILLGSKQLKDLIAFIRALDASEIKNKCKLKLLSENTQAFTEDDQINLAGSMVWGFAKVLNLEYASLFDGIVDYDDSISSDVLRQALAENAALEICLRNNLKYKGKLIKYNDYLKKQGKTKETIKIQENGSYLITGGNGPVGLAYAEALSELGARNIILMSRRGAAQGMEEKFVSFKEHGTNVTFVKADVTDKDSLSQAIQSFPKDFMPIKGVVHAAGTLKDGMISEMQWEDYQLVMDPKINGAIHIAHALDTKELDFFLMVSSITSIVGNMGQSNYAIANYFMNQYAKYLTKQGVPAYSVCWGPWGGGGMAEGKAANANISAMGMEKIELEQGKDLIKEFFNEPYHNVLVADVNWNLLNENVGNKSKSDFLSKLLAGDKSNANSGKAEQASDFLNTIKGLSSEEKEAVIIEEMTRRCCSIMGYENTDSFDCDKAFREQGADSLMLFSIRSAINKLLDIEIDISVLYNYSTLRSLTEHIVETNFADKEQASANDTKKQTDKLLIELEELID